MVKQIYNRNKIPKITKKMTHPNIRSDNKKMTKPNDFSCYYFLVKTFFTFSLLILCYLFLLWLCYQFFCYHFLCYHSCYNFYVINFCYSPFFHLCYYFPLLHFFPENVAPSIRATSTEQSDTTVAANRLNLDGFVARRKVAVDHLYAFPSRTPQLCVVFCTRVINNLYKCLFR